MQYGSSSTCQFASTCSAVWQQQQQLLDALLYTKHSVTYTQRKCQQCGTGVDNEQHLLFECSHVALVANRSKHMTLFDGVSDVREWMAAAYKPELAATLGSCMQGMLHCLKAGLEGQPNVTLAS